MEVARTIGSVMGSIKMLVNLIEENKIRGCTLQLDLNSVKGDLEILHHLRLKEKGQLTPAMELQLQELVYDIDDFIHGLSIPGKLRSFIPTAIGVDSRPGLILEVGHFKARIKNLKDELPNSSVSIQGGETSKLARPSLSPPSPEVDLVGVEGPKREIEELLSPRADPHGAGIGVISIVGCRGSGKTALARALYEDNAVAKDFDYKAWVVASDLSSAEILKKIHEEVVPASAQGSTCQDLLHMFNKILHRVPRLLASARWSTTSEALQNLLNKIVQLLRPAPSHRSTAEVMQHFQNNRRYLVFLDDVQPGAPWEDIKKAFRDNIKDSRIIVNTSVSSVARACSSGSYMHTLQHLDQVNSRKLFRIKFLKGVGLLLGNEGVLGDGNINFIVGRCDGLPMALISAAKCAHVKGADLNKQIFDQVSRELGECMACSKSDFELKKRNRGNEIVELRRALVEPYEKLLNSGDKDCLLYVSIFPSGHEINNKSIVRRLIAEELLPGDPELHVDDVCECLRMLMDQLMIEPVPIRNYYNVAKWCRVRSFMLEFTIKKAVSRNFVSLIQENNAKHNNAGKVRRLTVQSSPDAGSTGLDLSVLRSLAIFKSGIQNLKECRLVRVLDIEGWPVLTREVRDNICVLLFLKYLSLRNTEITELPKELENLRCLETLDSRETELITILPVEVIMLPELAYLFGKFVLTNFDKNEKKIKEFFSGGKSKLHTLGGICLDEAAGLQVVQIVLQHAKKLKKVKAWCNGTLIPNSSSLADNLKLNLETRCMDLESVSIDFNGAHNTFLGFLQTICTSTIGSIKLRKGNGNLPVRDILETARNLRKLHLFTTGLTSIELADLQYLQCLQYLKLAEDKQELWNSRFHVKVGGFKSLIWLCFEAPTLPNVLIDKGAMTLLGSLLLLCPVLRGVSGLQHLPMLNEIILNPSATNNDVTAWKERTKKYVNRPYVERRERYG